MKKEMDSRSEEEGDVIFKIRAGSIVIFCGCILMLAAVLGVQSILRYGLLKWHAGFGLVTLIGIAMVILGKRFNNRKPAQLPDTKWLKSLREPTECEIPADNQEVTEGPSAKSEIFSIVAKVKDTSATLGSRNYVTPPTRR